MYTSNKQMGTSDNIFDTLFLAAIWLVNAATGFEILMTIIATIGSVFYALKQIWDFFGWPKPFSKKKTNNNEEDYLGY